MFDKLIDILKANPRRIVFTEGPDARILEAASRLKKDGFLTPVLVGNVEEVKAAAAKGGFDIEGLEIIDPLTYDKMDEMVDAMVALRKGKMTPEECRELLKKGNYFGTMLVKMGVADSLLGGATYSTADTVRPALQLIKTRPGAHLVSSCFILQRGEELLAMGDCAINISYEDSVDKEGNVTVSAAQKLAEDQGARVFILSALHGLLDPATVVEPYDVKMGDRGCITPAVLADQLAAINPTTITTLLPKAYRLALVRAGAIVTDLYANAPGIGYQRGIASKILASRQHATAVDPAGHVYAETLF